MEITERLQQLAKFSDHTFPVISLYIRTLWPDQLRRTESAAFLSTHLQQARSLTLEPEDTRQSLARDLARIEAWGAARLSAPSVVTAASFARLLPPHVQRKIIDIVPLDQHDSHDRILHVAREALERHELSADRETIHLLLDSATGGGLGVIGLPDILAALNAGRVHTLVMNSDFQQLGWRCQDCDSIEHGTELPPQCTACNRPVRAVELGEAMVTEVLRCDGFVQPVAPDARLAQYDGIGALLRLL
jgi:peptide subunit release factor 1 (eRF1)